MELDELKLMWAEHDRKLDESIRLNRVLLRETYTRRARFALWRLVVMLGLGAIMMLPIIVGLGAFIATHWAEPKVAIPAILLDIASIAALAALIAQISLAMTINYDEPVAAIQKRLERLRRLRIRYIQAIFLASTLVWALPFILVTKAFAFNTTWVVENVAIGLAIPVVGYWLARHYGPRLANTSWGQRLVRDIAGYNLNAATRFLESLAAFEREDG